MARVGGAGTAFKAPSFNDLYFPLSASASPAIPNLRARALAQRRGCAALRRRRRERRRSTLFDNRIRDLIAVDPTFTTVINVNRARIRGATLAAGYAGGIWRADVEWTHQDPSDADTGTLLVRRARNHGARGRRGRRRAAGAAAPTGRASGARFDSAANTPPSRMGGYALRERCMPPMRSRRSCRVGRACQQRGRQALRARAGLQHGRGRNVFVCARHARCR